MPPSLRTLHHSAFPPERVAAEREATISVCVPARDEAATIAPVLEALLPLLEQGVIDQLLVADESSDGTGEIAQRLGAEVVRQSSIRPELGPVDGKGDAMWRALHVLRGDVVCFLDADSEDLGPHFASALAGPVACRGRDGGAAFAKAAYRRPLKAADGSTSPHGGGRVTELLARPLLRRHLPALAGFGQPLAGEIAARRELLEALPWLCGYAVDAALLVDAWREAGLGAMVEVDLGTRQNRHRPLAELAAMADAVLAGIESRLPGAGAGTDDLTQRPPMAGLTQRRAA